MESNGGNPSFPLSCLGENYLNQTLGADLLDLKIFEDIASVPGICRVRTLAEIWKILWLTVEAGEVSPHPKKVWEQISPCIAE